MCSNQGVTKRCRLGWPIAPSYLSPNAGGGRSLCQWVQLCGAYIHGTQINFGDPTPYLTYGSKNQPRVYPYCIVRQCYGSASFWSGSDFPFDAGPCLSYPTFYTCWKIGNHFFTLIHTNSSLQFFFSFLIKMSQIKFKVFWTAYWNFHEKSIKKYMCFEFIIWYRSESARPRCRSESGSCKMMRITISKIIFFNFVKFVATKKGLMDNKFFFSPLSFVAVFGSRIRDG